MEETARAVICKDKCTSDVLISKVIAYDSLQIQWAEGHTKGPPCGVRWKHRTKTRDQSLLSALALEAQCPLDKPERSTSSSSYLPQRNAKKGDNNPNRGLTETRVYINIFIFKCTSGKYHFILKLQKNGMRRKRNQT